MGYPITNKQIANITEPAKVTLSSNPNYIIFSRTDNAAEDKPVTFEIEIKGDFSSLTDIKDTEIKFTETATEVTHNFIGTKNLKEVNNTTFFVGETRQIIAENLRGCLMKNGFFRNNFNISVPPVSVPDEDPTKPDKIVTGNVIKFESKGCGRQFLFTALKGIDNDNFYTFSPADGKPVTTNNDTIDNGNGKSEIQLEIYGDTGVFLGEGGSPIDHMGTYRAEVSKKYFGQPMWFDVNTFSSNLGSYSDSILFQKGWADAGTMSDYRLLAKRQGEIDGKIATETFYITDVLYTLTGYTRNLEENDLSPYIYDIDRNNTVLPLTTQPALTHVKGQKQYFNFILSDRHHRSPIHCRLGILYKLYTPSGRMIGSLVNYEQPHNELYMVNTVELGIDSILTGYENVGIIKAYLCRNGEPVSKPLEFRILPDCLYKTRNFAFLNSLGGWSSFNFPSTEQTSFKTKAKSYFATRTPESAISTTLEGVQYKEVEEQFTVKTMPVDREVSDWLRELSSSVAVYEAETARYVVVDDLTLKYTTDEDLFQYEMKYHYSDSYNAK